MENSTSNRKLFLGLILIFIGVVFLIEQTGWLRNFNLSEHVFSFPSFFLLIGVVLWLNSRKQLLGAILFVFGIVLHISVYYDRGQIAIGGGFLLIGIYMILKHRFASGTNSKSLNNSSRRSDDKDTIDEISILGGGKRVINSQDFKGGSMVAIMGGSEIDLRMCKLAIGQQYLDVFIMMGGTEIIVPKDWNVKVDVIALFGGFSHKKPMFDVSQHEYNPESTLIIKGFTLFGGGEVKAF